MNAKPKENENTMQKKPLCQLSASRASRSYPQMTPPSEVADEPILCRFSNVSPLLALEIRLNSQQRVLLREASQMGMECVCREDPTEIALNWPRERRSDTPSSPLKSEELRPAFAPYSLVRTARKRPPADPLTQAPQQAWGARTKTRALHP